MAFAENTKVPIEQSIAEIIGMIRKAGAESIGQFEDRDKFTIVFALADRRMKFTVPLVTSYDGPRQARNGAVIDAATSTSPLFIGPGTWFWNPFQRKRISKPRALILYRAWLDDQLTPRILRAAYFSDDEIEALGAWLARLRRALPRIADRPLRCTCRRADAWCHRNSLAQSAATAAPSARLQ